jgi:anti-sigma factor RsiW
MMNGHVTPEEIRRFRAGQLPVGESRSVGNHIASCADCQRLAGADPAARHAADALARALVPRDASLEEEHAGPDTISAFVDGRLPDEQRVLLEEHLAECTRCSEDVEDLRTLTPARPAHRRSRELAPSAEWKPRPRRAGRSTFYLAAASVAAVLAVVVFLLPRRQAPTYPRIDTATHPTHTPTSTQPERPAPVWPAEVHAAVASGRLEPPRLFLDLQPPLDTLRGEETGASPATRLLFPVDEVVSPTKPTFRWKPLAGARYVVVIAEGGQLIARSGVLRESEWQPDRNLNRGHVYDWQLEVTRDGVTTTIPPSPEPPARFAVLSTREAAGIAAARTTTPDDHLLLGVLAAQSSLRREAETELRLAAKDESTAEPAGRLLKSLDRWPRRSGSASGRGEH